jgi:hypothetical protein
MCCISPGFSFASIPVGRIDQQTGKEVFDEKGSPNKYYFFLGARDIVAGINAGS